MYRAAERLNPDRYRRLTRAVYAEMALAGITSVGEFHYVHHEAGGAHYAEPNAMGQAVIDGAADARIRLTLLDTCYLSSGPDGSPLTGPQQRFGDGTGDRWAERVEALRQQVGITPSVLVGAALHSVRGVPVEHMPAVVEWAAAHGAPLHVHSSEQTREVEQCLAVHGRTPTAVLRDVGALGPRTTAVHATHLTSEDIADMDRTSTGVCFCPTTERDLGDGIGPAPALLAGRGLFSLGSDSHAVIDLFEEARAVELDERLASRTRGTIAADRLLRAATYDGHRALGWADAGELVVGARADFVAVQIDSIRTAGGGATAENVVFAAAAPDVTDVVVDGRAVVVDRKHVTVPDVESRTRLRHRGPDGCFAGGHAMTVLYTNIRELVTNDPANGDGDPLGIITDAALVVDGADDRMDRPTRGRARRRRSDQLRRHQRDPRIRRQPYASGVRG